MREYNVKRSNLALGPRICRPTQKKARKAIEAISIIADRLLDVNANKDQIVPPMKNMATLT